MTTRAKFAEFKERLLKLDKEKLVDAIAEYAASDFLIWSHFEVIAKMNETPDQSLSLIKARIEKIFGDQNLAFSYAFHELAPFRCISDHIETLINAKKYDETIEACEYAFSFDEKLGQVQDPDDFMNDCYDRIIDFWLKAHISKGISFQEIKATIEKKRQSDGFGLTYQIERRLAKIVQSTSKKIAD